MGRIIKDEERRPCLYCGAEMKRGYDDCDPFLYCDCPDYKKKEEICEEIERLRRKIPRPKYEIIKKDHLEKVKEG